MPTSELVDQYRVLIQLEKGAYVCQDYLSPYYQLKLVEKLTTKSQGGYISLSSETSHSSPASSNHGVINKEWRRQICEWIYYVIEHFEFDREIAFISMSYLDRYLSTTSVSKKTFELAATASLFLAIKLYEPSTPKISSFVDLSSGYFVIEHIVSMECSILCALSWYVHPPTPLNFVRNYVMLLEESGCSSAVADEVNEISRFLTEISVCEYYFTTCKPSLTGLATVLKAFERFDEVFLPVQVRETFLEHVRSIEVIDLSLYEVLENIGHISEHNLPAIKFEAIQAPIDENLASDSVVV